jgi:BlaI family penicillinase repressor
MKFGRVQLQIMRVLWERGRATAREITDALNQDDPIAHSTVQTLLRQLEDKAAIRHEATGRTFVFHPTVKPDKVKRGALRDLIDRVFEGSPSGLVAHLLTHERLSVSELQQIRELIDREAKP